MQGNIKVRMTAARWITLPLFAYTITPEDVETQSVMASGKIHIDHIGVRKKIKGTVPYIPQADFTDLIGLVRTGDFLLTEYIDEDGTVKQEHFKWSQLEAETFRFDVVSGKTVPTWVNVKIELIAQEVV